MGKPNLGQMRFYISGCFFFSFHLLVKFHGLQPIISHLMRADMPAARPGFVTLCADAKTPRSFCCFSIVFMLSWIKTGSDRIQFTNQSPSLGKQGPALRNHFCETMHLHIKLHSQLCSCFCVPVCVCARERKRVEGCGCE